MPRPHPKEFRDDVVAVARKGEAPISEVARDFGISESCLRNWRRRRRQPRLGRLTPIEYETIMTINQAQAA